MVQPWREVRPPRQTNLGSCLRSRTLRMAFAFFWLSQTLCTLVRKPRHTPCLEVSGDLGAVPSGGGPQVCFWPNPYGESRKVDGPLRPGSQGTRPGKAAVTHSRNLAPARRKRAAGERRTSSYWRIFWLNSKQHVIVRQNSSEKKNAGNLTSVQESKVAVNSFCNRVHIQ